METIQPHISIETDSLLTSVIRNRRTIYADRYIAKSIDKSTIEEIITNGTWAPNHKRTEPWRFVVLEGEHHQALGNFMVDYYKEHLTPEQFPESRYESTRAYPNNATIIAIIFQRSKRIQIPEWEEIAAISCAIQNIWLSCTTKGIGGYWDTSGAAIDYGNTLDLSDNERCLGLFYMGYYHEETNPAPNRRKPIHKKLSWNKK